MSRAPTRRPLLFLWGFMGTGKTSVGEALAHRLGLPFVDVDRAVVRTTGLSIEEIFATRGEAAFRELEAAEVRRCLESRVPTVVALGGGSLLDRRLRELALDRAFVVALSATVATLMERTAGSSRPLLAARPEVAIPKLLSARVAAYSEAHVTIRTDGRSADVVARDLEHLWLGWT